MSLGSSLEVDIKTALANSDNATTSSNNIASAINSYLAGAEYGSGALTYSGSVAGSAFKLATEGSVSAAAAKWGSGVMSYWGATATGTPATPTQLDSVVSGTITAGTVGTTLTASLTTIFSSTEGTLDDKASEIASAIEDAVATIVVAWSEFAAGPPPVTLPLTGGIE